jgi:hypothetical protein
MIYVGGSWATLLLKGACRGEFGRYSFRKERTSDRSSGTGTPGHLTLNLVFILSLSMCAYNFIKAVKMDPGWTRSDLNEEQLTEVRGGMTVSVAPH